MKVLYVLVSSESDFYYEQALVSITSLRHVMPKALITLLVDDKTDANLIGSRSKIKDIIDEYKVEPFDSTVNSVVRSRSLKTRMRELIRDDFLYVDVDTVWCEAFDENDFNADVMAVPDGHCLLEDHPLKACITETLRKLNYKVEQKYHYNGGIFFLKDSPNACEFSKKWHLLWKENIEKSIYVDQPSLNEVNYRMNSIIKRLPESYNAQIGRCLNYLASAKIIHYFATWNTNEEFEPCYEFLKKAFYQRIRKHGIDDNAMKLIRDPKKAFDTNTYVLNYEVTKKIFTPNGNMLLNILQSNNPSDKRLRMILIKIAKMYYKIIPILHPVYSFLKNVKSSLKI